MKKPTIKQLEAKVADLTVRLETERNARLATAEDLRKSNDHVMRTQGEMRTEQREHTAELNRERMAREDAQSSFVALKSTVMHYFLVLANPETAKDTEQVKNLQQQIALAGPDFQVARKNSY